MGRNYIPFSCLMILDVISKWHAKWACHLSGPPADGSGWDEGPPKRSGALAICWWTVEARAANFFHFWDPIQSNPIQTPFRKTKPHHLWPKCQSANQIDKCGSKKCQSLIILKSTEWVQVLLFIQILNHGRRLLTFPWLEFFPSKFPAQGTWEDYKK